MKSILILGAGIMQGPAIAEARARGFRVHAVDGNPSAIHARSADAFSPVDLKDLPSLEAYARGIPGLAGVFTAGTDFSYSVAWLASRLGLPGISTETALAASDKARMRERLSAAGVPCPAFVSARAGSDPRLAAASLPSPRGDPYPLVVKPVDNMGARGCRLVRDEAELLQAFEEAVGYSRTATAIIEGYLDGPEFSLDAVVRGGKARVCGIADRNIRFSPYFVELGHTMPSAYGEEVLSEVVDVFMRGIAALDIRDGAAKGDIKYTKDGAFVGEIAARLSGGYMSGWTYPYATGASPTGAAIDIATGRPPAGLDPLWACVSAERAFISIPGVVAEVAGLPEAARRPFVKDVFPRVASGDSVRFPVNNVEKCGNVISQAPSRADAERAAESAVRDILIRLEPRDPDTEAFLEGRSGDAHGRSGTARGWPPEAFPDASAMLLASMDKLPDLLRSPDGRGRGKGTRISIAPLPALAAERCEDWHGRTLADTLDAIRRMTGAAVGTDGETVVGRRFWRAVMRGGYQAGSYVVETALLETDRP